MADGLLFGFSRIFGLTAYSSSGKHNILLMIWTWFIFALYLVISIGSKIMVQVQLLKGSHISEVLSASINNFQQIINSVCLFFHVYVNSRERRQFEGVFSVVRTAESGIYDQLWTLIAAGITFTCGILWYIHMEDIWLSVDHLCNIFSVFATTIILLQFCSILSRLCIRLKITKAPIKNFKVDYLEHSKLINIAENANSAYDIQLLLICATIFCNLVSSTYSVIGAIIANNSADNVSLISLLILLIILRILMLFWLTTTCEQIAFTADTFNTELFTLLRNNKELCENDTLRVYTIVRQSVNISACGFFEVGYPLVTSIVGAATTYLVILIQFSAG